VSRFGFRLAFEQLDKAFLFEVFVSGQCVEKLILTHSNKTHRIAKRIIFSFEAWRGPAPNGDHPIAAKPLRSQIAPKNSFWKQRHH
jgi:hypothetical protein